MFENDVFVKWLDKEPSKITYSYNNIHINRHKTNTQDKQSTSNSLPSGRTYIGMKTSYGTIVELTSNTFTVEKREKGSDGYDKVKTVQYPLYLLK